MSLALDLYVPGRSWLHRLDPRVKLWATLLGVLLALRLPHPLLQAAFLLGLHLFLWRAGIPWERLVWLWRQLLVLLIFILLLQPFFTPSGTLLFALGPLRLTLGGLQAGLLFALRALNMAFVTGGLLFTTDQQAMIRGLVRLGVPYTWGLTISLTLRFLPALSSLFVTVREAQAARGWVAEGNFIRRTREYLPVLVAVIIGTLRMSDQLTLALAARGLGSSTPRTVWRDLRMQRSDWAALALLTAGFALLLWLLR